MTVKCLGKETKRVIGDAFLSGTVSINTLASNWRRSRRTIIRVLTEQGIDTGLKRRTPKVRIQMELFPELNSMGQTVFNVAPKEMHIPKLTDLTREEVYNNLLTASAQKKNSWFRRMLNTVAQLRHGGVAGQ